MSDTALVVMARYPERGKTKTRLACTIGDDNAVKIYRAFLTDLAQRFATQEAFDLYWAYTPANVNYACFVAELSQMHTQKVKSFPQEGLDLGARLHQAFIETQKRAFKRTIVIGSDSPHISLNVITNAQKALDDADLVLGPAEDGGYYLIAMRRPYDVFSGIPMSTNEVLRMTIELAKRQGLRIHLLQPLFDIDELDDLMRLAELLQQDYTLAPATAAYFASKRSLYDNYNSTRSHSAALDLHRTDQSL